MSEGHAKVAGLVPAAGASRRMGRDKRLLVLGGATVLEAVVGALQRGGVDPVVVVLEPASSCRQLPGLRSALLAENPAPERGMLSSIRVGLARLPREAAAAAVLPGDHPFVSAEAVAALLEHFRRHRPLLLAPRYAGRRGHPLIVARELFAEAAACSDEVGLRELVHRREAELALLDVVGVERDLDTPEDLEG